MFFLSGYSVLARLLCSVSHLVFLRNICIRTQRAAVASRRATNLATHPSPCIPYSVQVKIFYRFRIWYFTVVLGMDYFARYVGYVLYGVPTVLVWLIYCTNFLLFFGYFQDRGTCTGGGHRTLLAASSSKKIPRRMTIVFLYAFL